MAALLLKYHFLHGCSQFGVWGVQSDPANVHSPSALLSPHRLRKVSLARFEMQPKGKPELLLPLKQISANQRNLHFEGVSKIASVHREDLMVAGSIHLPCLQLSCLTALLGLYGQGSIYLTADPGQTAYAWPSLAGLGEQLIQAAIVVGERSQCPHQPTVKHSQAVPLPPAAARPCTTRGRQRAEVNNEVR